MQQFAVVTEDDVRGAVAPFEVPHDVNPLDPDDENWYFNYDNWRDEQDAEADLNCDEQVLFEEADFDYHNHVVDQVSQW